MAARQTALRISKSIAGAALLLLGMFILYEKLAGAVVRLSHDLANGSKALGVLPAAVLAVSQAAHAFDHHQLLQCFFGQILVSSWPLILVIFGTVLSRDNSRTK